MDNPVYYTIYQQKSKRITMWKTPDNLMINLRLSTFVLYCFIRLIVVFCQYLLSFHWFSTSPNVIYVDDKVEYILWWVIYFNKLNLFSLNLWRLGMKVKIMRGWFFSWSIPLCFWVLHYPGFLPWSSWYRGSQWCGLSCPVSWQCRQVRSLSWSCKDTWRSVLAGRIQNFFSWKWYLSD